MKFIRGDTFPFKFQVKRKDGTAIIKDDIDVLFITVKTSIYTDKVIFQKTLNDIEIDEEGDFHVVFSSKDTENLNYGKYIFDIEITLKSGYRKTKLFEFELIGETTFHKDGGGENA